MPPALPDPETLLLYDGFVRGIARGLVHGADEVDEVVQQTWVAALMRSAGTIVRPRAFLARLVRNVATDRRRMADRRVRHEQAAARPEATPSAADILTRELWRKRIVQAVLALAEPYRETVLLRYFEHLPPRAIAARQSVPVETVRTRTRRALEQLRRDLADEHGEPQLLAALTPLLDLAHATPVGPAAGPASPLTATSGTKPLATGALMSTKAKGGLLAAAFLGVTAVLLWSPWEPGGERVADEPGSSVRGVADTTAPGREARPVAGDSAGAVGPTASRRAVAVAEKRDAPCALRVSVTWPDGSPAAGIGVSVSAPGTALAQVAARTLLTDRTGAASFARLRPGAWRVELDRGAARDAALAPGQELEVRIAVPLSPDLRGLVVDPADRPVAGAEIVLESGRRPLGGVVAAHAGADGRFELRCIGLDARVSARAKGHAPSVTYDCGSDGTLAPIERTIRLRADPVEVSGRVSGPDGEPLADVLLILGSSERVHWFGRVEVPAEPPPLLARSDARGAFRFADCPTGNMQLAAASSGFAPHRIALRLEPGASRHVELRVPAAAWLSGVVRGTTAPMRGVRISAAWPHLTSRERVVWQHADAHRELLANETDTLATDLEVCAVTETDTEGRYELGPLPSGDVEIAFAWGDESLARTPHLQDGARERLDVTIASGVTVRGRVIDESGRPVVDAVVEVSTTGMNENARTVHRRSDGDGRFSVEGCRPGSKVALVLVGSERMKGLDAFRVAQAAGHAGDAEVILRVDSRKVPSVRVVGRLVDVEGRPVHRAGCFPFYRFADGAMGMNLELEDGRFELGLLPPGELTLSIGVTGQPRIVVGPRRVAANETWDVGELRPPPAVTAKFTIDFGDLPREPSPELGMCRDGCWVSDLEVEFAGSVATVGGLAPGDYQVVLWRDDIAQQRIPVRVEAAGDNAFALRVGRGVKVSLRIREESGLPALHPVVRLDVVRADGIGTADATCILNEHREALVESLCLAPGRYRVTAESITGATGAAELVVTGTRDATVTTVILR